ncbi:PREDICTED: uncharacterized protein LOC104780202 [Camelina sativa]|uniref:Uncharacterized protein LOC104780202 n=1 Tax=Camelina sativa TaxID=90675 RepID=A0ABM0YLX2_CAMSA|nr:PREDICTED: uncharacterized protein LOC104780202 [Camelina sativa]
MSLSGHRRPRSSESGPSCNVDGLDATMCHTARSHTFYKRSIFTRQQLHPANSRCIAECSCRRIPATPPPEETQWSFMVSLETNFKTLNTNVADLNTNMGTVMKELVESRQALNPLLLLMLQLLQ